MRRFGQVDAGLPALGAGTHCRRPVGSIDVALLVAERGEVADPYVARSTAPWLDEKAPAVVRGLPKRFWPGQHNGETVRAAYHVPGLFYIGLAARAGRRGAAN